MLRQRNCMHCQSADIVRSHRHSWERIIVFLRPYRCNDCHRRFYTLASLRLPSRAF
jgi:hypothetical protein